MGIRLLAVFNILILFPELTVALWHVKSVMEPTWGGDVWKPHSPLQRVFFEWHSVNNAAWDISSWVANVQLVLRCFKGIVNLELTFHPFTTGHFVNVLTFSNSHDRSGVSPMERISSNGYLWYSSVKDNRRHSQHVFVLWRFNLTRNGDITIMCFTEISTVTLELPRDQQEQDTVNTPPLCWNPQTFSYFLSTAACEITSYQQPSLAATSRRM